MIEERYRTFWPRFGAMFIDGLVLFPLSLLGRFIWARHSDISPILLLSWCVARGASVRLYFILMHGRFGQTLGKMAFGVIVVDGSEQTRLSMVQAIKRDIVPVITFFVGIVILAPIIMQGEYPFARGHLPPGYGTLNSSVLIWALLEMITMLANKRRRAVHDFIAGSVVVKKSSLTSACSRPQDGGGGRAPRSMIKGMNKILKWTVMVVIVFIAAGVILPRVARHPRTGSKEYARKWREQLQVCNSPDDANELFTCYRIGKTPTPEGGTQYIPDVTHAEDRPLALIHSFDDGSWVVCVHSPTHGPRSGPGAGTVVTRDSRGKMAVYLGHICDRIGVSGDTLEDFYSSLEKEYRFRVIKDD